MKFTVAVVAALSCFMLASSPNFAQPADAPFDRTAKNSLYFENTDVLEIAQTIADRSKVEIIVTKDVTGEVTLFQSAPSTPEVALQRLAQAAHLSLKKIDEKTYVLSKESFEELKRIEAAQVIEKAKPYTIKFRFDKALTQEIQVKENDEFGISTTIGNTQWIIKGVNTHAETGMTIRFHLERRQDDKNLATVKTVAHTSTDGKEVSLGGMNSVTKAADGKEHVSDFVISVSVRKNAP